MFKKFLIILYMAIIAIVIYFSTDFLIALKNSDDSGSADRAQKRVEKILDHENQNDDEDMQETITETVEENQEELEEVQVAESAYKITTEDCDNECTNYHDDGLNYCKQVCGLSPQIIEESESCDSLSGLSKDYCIRNKAVAEENLEKCIEIKDSGVRSQCQKRIQEDIIDQIM